MTWKNHKLTTFAVVFSLTGSFTASSIAAASSHLPDIMELRGVVPHRTFTHYPYPFIAGAMVLWLFLLRGGGLGYYVAFFVTAGVLFHLIQDGMSLGGIPLKTPRGKRWGVKWYVTRESSEKIVVLYVLLGSLALAAIQGFLAPSHLEYTVLVGLEILLSVVKSIRGVV